MDHYQFVFETTSTDRQNELVALLDNIGFEGFEEGETQLKAFIPMDKFNQEEFDVLMENNPISYIKSIIKETNWNQIWESSFEPVVIDHPITGLPFAAVRAEFHEPVPGVEFDLLVTPRMSFGTGHHATTYQVIQQMSLLDFKGKSVIDFGTGTGVLAILAEKMGSVNLIAIDNDEWSINNAGDNISANACSHIQLLKAETIEPGMQADFILANINLNIIIANLDNIRASCKMDTILLFSGIMEKDKEQILGELKQHNFELLHCKANDNWLVLLVKA